MTTRRIACGVIAAAVAVACSAAPADDAIRVGVICLKGDRAVLSAAAAKAGEAKVQDVAFLRAGAKLLPRKAGTRIVKTECLAVGRDAPELSMYDVVVLVPMWSAAIADLDAHAKVFHEYIRGGGGLVVFQPNPYGLVWPAGSKPSPAMKHAKLTQDYCTPRLLPLAATFGNWYDRKDGKKVTDAGHVIVHGFGDETMPFPADQMFDLSPAYRVLARGTNSGSPSLAVGTFGDGRIVLWADNIGGGTYSRPPIELVQRAILWAAGEDDNLVLTAAAPPWAGPKWPTPAGRAAMRAGTLKIRLQGADARIRTYDRVDFTAEITNTGYVPVPIPSWSRLLTVEVSPAGDASNILTWTQPSTPADYVCIWTLTARGGSRGAVTSSFFPRSRMAGLPGEWPYLGPGKYRWRIVLGWDPAVRSQWVDLEIVPRTPTDAARAAAKRRPKGRLIVVEPNSMCPAPTGSIQRPFGNLPKALAAAKAGDVVFIGVGQVNCAPVCVPDDVWVIGAGPSNTAVIVSMGARKGAEGPSIELAGSSRLEGVTVISSAGTGRGVLLSAKGKDAKPTVVHCVLIGAAGDFATVFCRDGGSPTLRNCMIVSPVGNYGVFARHGSRPTLEYCTIVSRGFGVGVMDSSFPTLRRCIIAGQCPAVIAQPGCEFAISDSVISCKVNSTTFPHPVMLNMADRFIKLPGVMNRRDIYTFDPKFQLAAQLPDYLRPAASSDAAAYGALAKSQSQWTHTGNDVNHPAWARKGSDPNKRLWMRYLPDLKAYLDPPTKPSNPGVGSFKK